VENPVRPVEGRKGLGQFIGIAPPLPNFGR
jgi:hypothetical protein